jgi:peroxiredoxin
LGDLRSLGTAQASTLQVMSDYLSVPDDLPRPQDDGAAAHLAGMRMPNATLAATDGEDVELSGLGPGRSVIYVYPMTGVPGVALPDGWDEIPGARGCTPESCGFRDHHAELLAAGAGAVYGLSSQDTDYQREVAERLELPFAMLSDPGLQLATAIELPTFELDGVTRYRRLTVIVTDGRVEHVFYPIFPPGEHAATVLAWLRDHA